MSQVAFVLTYSSFFAYSFVSLEREFKPHTFDWVIENLREQPSYLERPMFGCRACYLKGELKLVLADSEDEPWQGLLVATSKEHHGTLLAEFPELVSHPVLGKWLYLAENQEQFERVALSLAKLVLKGDARIGVLPEQKKRKVKRKARS